MKIHRNITTGILAAGALLLAGSARSQASTPNLIIYSSGLDLSGTQGGQSDEYTGAPGTGGCTVQPTYASSTIWWDDTEQNPPGDGGGSIYVIADFINANNTCLNDTFGFDYDNWYYNGNGTVDFTLYNAVQFDILWDTNSTLTIGQFNTGDGWPAAWVPSWADTNFIAEQGLTTGLEIDCMSSGSGGNTYLGNVSIPDFASNQWVTVTVPYSDAIAGIGSGSGIYIHKYFGGNWGLPTNPAPTITGAFWIDNVILISATPPPPPTLSPPTPATPGLNIFNGTEGNSYYDRNEVLATTTTGLSWVGNTPATYSFNLASFPTVPVGSYSGEAYMFLVPNSVNQDNAPDYNESNCLVLEIQTPDNVKGAASVSYKVNAAGGEPPGSNQVVYVTSSKLLGTYSITFTDNDDGYVTTPDGTKGNFSLPPGTGAAYFAETGTEPNNFLIYLGGQANQASAMNQAVVYGSFSMAGPPNSSSVTEVFSNETSLQNWEARFSGGIATSDPAAVAVVPQGAPYWVSWTLPATGFSLNDAASLPCANWNTVATYSPIPLYQKESQLVGSSDLQSPANNQYFDLVKRVYSPASGSLLIAFPGQTFVNGVGVTGTPTPIAGDGNWEPNGPVYVYAVDSGNHLVTSITDGISLYNGGPDADPISGDFASDSGGNLSENMVGGIATFNTGFDNSFSWGNAGLTAPATVSVQVIDYTLQGEDNDQNTFNSSPVSLVNQ